jgi:hypothetical protein
MIRPKDLVRVRVRVSGQGSGWDLRVGTARELKLWHALNRGTPPPPHDQHPPLMISTPPSQGAGRRLGLNP